jgi:hypothetical protein
VSTQPVTRAARAAYEQEKSSQREHLRPFTQFRPLPDPIPAPETGLN